MNGFQNKKSACLIRLRYPVFLFPCPPNLLSKVFPESHENKKTDIESLTNHVRRLRYPSSNYFVHWTKPHFSETILLIISGFSILSCYTILRSVTSLLLLHFFTYVWFISFIAFSLLSGIIFRSNNTFSSYHQTEFIFSDTLEIVLQIQSFICL